MEKQFFQPYIFKNCPALSVAQTLRVKVSMWYFLDCHSAQCDNESGGDCGYCKKDFYGEIDKIVEQLKNELSNH